MTDDQITNIALAHGFNLKEQPDGSMALNPYVYQFARALLKANRHSELEREHFGDAPVNDAVEVWASIDPKGKIIADSDFTNEDDTWCVALGWPDDGEIKRVKRQGHRVCRVKIVVPPKESKP